MIIFRSILTTFELSSIFGGSRGSIENLLKPKTVERSVCLINVFFDNTNFIFKVSILYLILRVQNQLGF